MAVQSQAAPGGLQIAAPERKQRTLWGDVWRRFRRHKLAMFGTFVFIVLILLTGVGPYFYTVDPKYGRHNLCHSQTGQGHRLSIH